MPVTGYLGAVASLGQGALAALAVPAGSRRSSVAVSRAASNAGFVIGPPVGALLAGHGYDTLFVIDGVLTLVLRHVTSRFLPDDAPVAPAPDAPAGLWRAVRGDRSLLTLLPGVVLVDLVYRQLYSTLPLHLRDHGQPLALYTLLVAVGSGLILALEIPVALWLRHRPAIPMLATGYALVAVGFVIFGLTWLGVAAAAVVAMVVLTAGEILYKTTATAHVLDAAPAHLVGQYQGLYTGAATSGTMLSAPLGGIVYAAAPGLLWPLCGVVAGVGALLGGHLGYRQALGANHAEDITHVGPADWQPLGLLADLPEGVPLRRRAGAVDVVVVRRGADVNVLADRCSHLSAPLSDGELVDADGDARLVCPWHGSQFRVADGCVVHGPATASAPRFETRMIGQSVETRVVPIPGVDATPDRPDADLQHDLAVANNADTGVARNP
jgi:nitrite reductase/ring-hydroxylating ferredoxin subunit